MVKKSFRRAFWKWSGAVGAVLFGIACADSRKHEIGSTLPLGPLPLSSKLSFDIRHSNLSFTFIRPAYADPLPSLAPKQLENPIYRIPIRGSGGVDETSNVLMNLSFPPWSHVAGIGIQDPCTGTSVAYGGKLIRLPGSVHSDDHILHFSLPAWQIIGIWSLAWIVWPLRRQMRKASLVAPDPAVFTVA